MTGIIGGKNPSQQALDAAYQVGMLLSKKGMTIICGGLGGVMEAAARGASSVGGTVIGVLPSADLSTANPYITHAIATGFGDARNLIIINTATAFIAIDGEYGTLSEIAFALSRGKKVIGLHTKWDIEGVISAESPEDAVAKLFSD